MKKLLVVLGLVAGLGFAAPSPASAYFSFGIGLPGFGLFVHEPCPRPVYTPPAYYPPPPVVYYQPAPVVYPAWPSWYASRSRHDHGWHRGWYHR